MRMGHYERLVTLTRLVLTAGWALADPSGTRLLSDACKIKVCFPLQVALMP